MSKLLFIAGLMLACGLGKNEQNDSLPLLSKPPVNKTDTLFGISYIQSYPIKIDGGCSFYTFDSVSFDKKQFIFIVGAKERGFIMMNGAYVYFYRTNRQKTATGYIEFYKGDRHNLKLDITKIEIPKTDTLYNTIRQGKLTITSGIKMRVIDVRGGVDQFDTYSH